MSTEDPNIVVQRLDKGGDYGGYKEPDKWVDVIVGVVDGVDGLSAEGRAVLAIGGSRNHRVIRRTEVVICSTDDRGVCSRRGTMPRRTFDKRICTHKWGNNPTNDEFTNTNGFIISGGTYNRTVEFVLDLAREAVKDFPFLKMSDMEVFVITKSTYNKGFMGIRFALPENKKNKRAGYVQVARIDFGYE